MKQRWCRIARCGTISRKWGLTPFFEERCSVLDARLEVPVIDFNGAL
jgi:hypothetical protein